MANEPKTPGNNTSPAVAALQYRRTLNTPRVPLREVLRDANDCIPGLPRKTVLRPVGKPMVAEDILKTVLSYRGLDKKLAEYQWVTKWTELVGKGIAAHSTPVGLRNGVLTVGVSSSTWAQELQFRKSVIIKRLRAVVSETVVINDVRFVVAGSRLAGK